MDRYEIVVIGSGNVAEAFTRALVKCSGVSLKQVYARNEERGRAVAALGRTEWSGCAEELATADLYIIAVSDSVVEEVATSLPIPPHAIVVHTAGSVPLDAIPKRVGGRGIIYPLQSFTKGRTVNMDDVPLFVEADGESTRENLMRVASMLSSHVEYATSERRKIIHLAGVFVNNFSNHMYALGRDVLTRSGLSFDILKPLIHETAEKAIAADNPRDVQTGPAVRNDKVVVERHLELLADDECKQKIYKDLTDSIWETSKRI